MPVIVTSYEIVLADIKALVPIRWKYVVVDEGHRLKNFNSKLLRELRTLKIDNKLLLTGPASALGPHQPFCRANKKVYMGF